MSQQRTSALRRVRPNIRGVQFANVDWLPAAFDGNTIKFYIFQAGQNLLATLAGCTLAGVPQIVQTSPPLAPVDAWLDGQFLVIDYGVPQGPGITLYAGPNVAEFRGPFGEYLSMKEYVIGAPVVPVDAVVFALALSGTGVDLILDGSGGPLYCQSPAGIANLTNAEVATINTSNGGTIHVEFPTPCVSGDVIEWIPAGAPFLNPTGGGLAGFTTAIP